MSACQSETKAEDIVRVPQNFFLKDVGWMVTLTRGDSCLHPVSYQQSVLVNVRERGCSRWKETKYSLRLNKFENVYRPKKQWCIDVELRCDYVPRMV